MPKQSLPLWSLIRLLPKALLYAVAVIVLFVFALFLAAFGRRSLLDDMISTFRRWQLLPPKTAEEKHNRAVSFVNQRYLTHGFGWRRFVLHLIWRKTGGRLMGHFLDDKAAELKASFTADFIYQTAQKDDLALLIAATSLLDKYIGMLIVVRFLVSISKRDFESVFQGEGPLSRFSAKIRMATVLGLLIGDMPHDLAILKKLRNDFAHAITPQKLSGEPHSARCRSLKMSYDLHERVAAACGTDERRKVMACVTAQLIYMSIVLQRGIVERRFLQEHSSEISAQTTEEMAKIMANASQGGAGT